jgi:hypothetical protein
MAQEIGDIETFARQISELKIELSQTPEGVFTVRNTSEPFFCYEAETREQLHAWVIDTVRSYARHFFNLDLPPVSTESEDIEEGPLPIERSTPVSRIKPVFDLAA